MSLSFWKLLFLVLFLVSCGDYPADETINIVGDGSANESSTETDTENRGAVFDRCVEVEGRPFCGQFL